MLSLAEAPTRLEDDAPVIRLFDRLLETAIRSAGSDLHIDATPDGGRVRVRVSGTLRLLETLPDEHYRRLVVRVKVLSQLDIAERRIPQDGHFTYSCDGRRVELRVATLPTAYGEHISLRILDSVVHLTSLQALGVAPDMEREMEALIGSDGGLVIICGPTGSGKTTTLYRLASLRNQDCDHICTVEDPIEMSLPGTTQSQVSARGGAGYEQIARAILRADPNVVVLGEMRDEATAAVALSAALSGHLVLTTLHASDALGAIERLGDLGIQRSVLAYVLKGIISQRLVSQKCSCTSPSCSCQDARTGLFECITVEPELRSLMASSAPTHEMRTLLSRCGWISLRDAGKAALIAGKISSNTYERTFAGMIV